VERWGQAFAQPAFGIADGRRSKWLFRRGPARLLSGLLLDRYSAGVLPGSAFGEPPDALRLRPATGLLYGAGDEQREAALSAPDPVRLPWIASALGRITEILTDLRG